MDKITAFRKIVDEKQFGKVDGQKVDLFSASAVVKVYDALSPEAQAKFVSFSVRKMVTIAFKLIK